MIKQLNFARYEIPIPEGFNIARNDIKSLLNNKKLTVIRSRENITREVEAGKFIENLELFNDKLLADILQTPEGHIKPDEILIFGLGFDSDAVKPLTIHRKNQFQKFGGRLIEPLDLV